MKERTIHLVNAEAQTNNAGTYRKRLPAVGSLHALLVTMTMTNGSTGGHTVDMLDVIDEIRVTSARQNPIFSLSSEELVKWWETENGEAVIHDADESADAVQTIMLPILFGRTFIDKEVYLPLGRFGSVDLEIDFSPTIAADLGFATGTFTVDIIAIMTPQEVSLPYQHTFITRRLEAFTTVASGEHRVPLPEDALIRKIGVYCYENAVEDGVNVSRLQLVMQDGSTTLYDADWLEFMWAQSMYGAKPIVHKAKLLAQDNDVWNCGLANVKGYSLEQLVAIEVGTDTLVMTAVDAIAGDRLTLDMALTNTATTTTPVSQHTTDIALFIQAWADVPGFFGFIPFFFPDDLSGYLDLRGSGGAEVIYTQGGAGGSLQTSIQEIKSFS